MIHFKYLLYLYVLIGFSASSAGSYDDFFKAVEFDKVETVQQLLERGFDPNSPTPKGQPALIYAMQQSSHKVVELLVNWPSTKLSIKNPQNETPLMLAAIQNKLALANLLILRGADVNQPGWTPLHYAASGVKPDIMTILLDHSAYIDAESPNGSTPLMMLANSTWIAHSSRMVRLANGLIASTRASRMRLSCSKASGLASLSITWRSR